MSRWGRCPVGPLSPAAVSSIGDLRSWDVRGQETLAQPGFPARGGHAPHRTEPLLVGPLSPAAVQSSLPNSIWERNCPRSCASQKVCAPGPPRAGLLQDAQLHDAGVVDEEAKVDDAVRLEIAVAAGNEPTLDVFGGVPARILTAGMVVE